jgi:hypothetical protein
LASEHKKHEHQIALWGVPTGHPDSIFFAQAFRWPDFFLSLIAATASEAAEARDSGAAARKG